jgi:imidazolonepropionase-like amidohydrolase
MDDDVGDLPVEVDHVDPHTTLAAIGGALPLLSQLEHPRLGGDGQVDRTLRPGPTLDEVLVKGSIHPLPVPVEPAREVVERHLLHESTVVHAPSLSPALLSFQWCRVAFGTDSPVRRGRSSEVVALYVARRERLKAHILRVMGVGLRALRARVAFDGVSFFPEGVTVVLDGGLILGVEPFGCDLPPDCPVTDVDGTLLPGLIDAHVHLVADGEVGSLEQAGSATEDDLDAVIARTLSQQAAAGVTTVRDLGDSRFRTLAFRDQLAAGVPRIVASGPPLTVPGGHCHFLGAVAGDVDAARRLVAEHHERGVDVIKVMASGGMMTAGTDVFGVQFSLDVLRAVVDAAHRMGLEVLAHTHSLSGISHALDAGVDGLEHFTGLTTDGVHVPDHVLDRVAAAEVAVDPTLGFDKEGLAAMPGPPAALAEALRRASLDFATAYAARLEVVARAQALGVRVVSGSDAGVGPLKRHGCVVLAVIDLPAAGLSTEQSLATATSSAAVACGIERDTGRLARGLAADLLAVAGDLRSDLEPLRHPTAIIVRGHDVLA